MRYLISISYDGSKYHGMQKLKNKPTIQGELEDVLTKMNEKKALPATKVITGVISAEVSQLNLRKILPPIIITNIETTPV